ncbi:MAG: TIGR03862 family flavoprotein [Pigmentiphaga sp.]|uniref:TIGR03862 family flavoprotein n=1 Tax=Pigmentiphaga sp. TaxID=1977564 RepID=UPI0029BAB977|nr:TIGR03862 family flavoprotein [Pigmentiphaga sp.]MDX3904409.1 TIGR03862 family flavoprotein [Pigmentiphaga sp.]
MAARPAVAVVGAGPAGLMAAEVLAQAGIAVDVYDAMPSAGRKFLLAGIGGLNITHSEPPERFLARYGNRATELAPVLAAFGSRDVRLWAEALGIETFVGSSGRVFPQEMKAAPLLRAWLHRLRTQGVRLHMRHRWLGWDENGALPFETPAGRVVNRPDAVVLALGGASWPRLGSDGRWAAWLEARGVKVAPLLPANCGFEVDWSAHFKSRFAGHPVRAVTLDIADGLGAWRRNGEFVVSDYGLEGSLIYAASARLRDAIARDGQAVIHLDLVPGLSLDRVLTELARPRGTKSMANHLRARVRVDGVKAGLLREVVPAADFHDPIRLASRIKSLPITLRAPRPIEEAISSAGGVSFAELDDGGMLVRLPGVFCAGEMLDWEAPTGGYLLTACLASGRWAGHGVARWLAGEARRTAGA